MQQCEFETMVNEIQNKFIDKCFKNQMSYSNFLIINAGEKYCIEYDPEKDVFLITSYFYKSTLKKLKHLQIDEFARNLLHAMVIKYMCVMQIEDYMRAAKNHGLLTSYKDGRYNGEYLAAVPQQIVNDVMQVLKQTYQ